MTQPALAVTHMAKRIKFHFEPDKAVEVILYVANRVRDPGFHRVSKVMYFADRDHLATYGRFICGDSYVAMKHGPVPSGTYDILKFVRGDEIAFPCAIPHAKDSFRVDNGKSIIPSRDANLELLSESEKECLDAAIAKYSDMPFGQLTDISHDKAWESADENDFIEIEQIVATLPDSKTLLDHLANPHPD